MKSKVKVGDKVYINSKYFTPDKQYIVTGVYPDESSIRVRDDGNCLRAISEYNYEVVTFDTDIISASKLIGKSVKDGKMIHDITGISILVKGVKDDSIRDRMSSVTIGELGKLKTGDTLIVLHDKMGCNFPYKNHVEMNQIDVKLNDKYTAKVSKDSITVGCQTFPTSILKELSEAYDKLI